jgi:rfaE bifunctional protein nucleotidyltransferase chain/domain
MKKIWTNGCFDVLHIGHIKMLQFARSLGDNLIVGIDNDERVASLKGNNRPINNQDDRVEFLRSIKYVDDVFVFNSKENMCDILVREEITDMVIGEEYRNKEITGGDIVSNIHFFQKVEGFSTTEIINEIGS